MYDELDAQVAGLDAGLFVQGTDADRSLSKMQMTCTGEMRRPSSVSRRYVGLRCAMSADLLALPLWLLQEASKNQIAGAFLEPLVQEPSLRE